MKIEGVASEQAGAASIEARLVDRLSAAFNEAGWDVSIQAEKADLVLARGRDRYVAEVKVAREPRRAEIEGALANAILQAKAYARAIDAKPLAVAGAPHISEPMAAALRDYAREYGEGSSYGLMDLRGRLELHGPGLEGIGSSSESVVGRDPKRAGSPRVDLFSDLGQWLLKVLVAPLIPEKYLSAPRVPIRNARHLAEVAKVSVPHASRQVAQLRELGFLAHSSPLKLVRIGELLELWRAANRRLPLDIAARWLFPGKSAAEQLKKSLKQWSEARVQRGLLPQQAWWSPGSKRVALALFAACEALDLGLVSGAPLHVYAEDVSPKAFEELGLVAARPGERVDVFVRPPRCGEAVFRGAVWRDGVAASDVLQAWMDVGDHPVRGEEQAQHLWNRILKPSLVRN